MLLKLLVSISNYFITNLCNLWFPMESCKIDFEEKIAINVQVEGHLLFPMIG